MITYLRMQINNYNKKGMYILYKDASMYNKRTKNWVCSYFLFVN